MIPTVYVNDATSLNSICAVSTSYGYNWTKGMFAFTFQCIKDNMAVDRLNQIFHYGLRLKDQLYKCVQSSPWLYDNQMIKRLWQREKITTDKILLMFPAGLNKVGSQRGLRSIFYISALCMHLICYWCNCWRLCNVLWMLTFII